jgi:hypothetical protein
MTRLPSVRNGLARVGSRRGELLTVLVLALGCVACASRATPSLLPSPRVVDGGSICGGLADRFIALPALQDGKSEAAKRPAASAGRWWIRGCSATLHDGEVHARLQGPGWYFVDEADGDLSLRQQVPFTLSVSLSGRLTGDIVASIFSLWFLPNAEPRIELAVSDDLDVRASSAWGSVLQVMPLVPVRSIAAERFSNVAGAALRRKLEQGATVTYDLGSGQEDVTLGQLARGKVPERAFRDQTPWLVNERLLLGPSVVHVFGPIAPGPTRVDLDIESGEGVAYRALCTRDMDDSYTALATGHVDEMAEDVIVARGTIAGAGRHTSDFSVNACRFYLVVSATGSAPTTLVALRVRA